MSVATSHRITACNFYYICVNEAPASMIDQSEQVLAGWLNMTTTITTTDTRPGKPGKWLTKFPVIENA